MKRKHSLETLGASRLPECIALAAYMGLLAYVMSAHEPWFDEAQAWLMARDLSIPDLLFHWLRYEGHPPLWYLLLSIPAKLGVPYEWGLKSAGFLCASAAAAVFIFRAPFPRIIRLVLPFTYYFFYQYGVISRCYALLMLFLWLAAVTYQQRNIRPFRFIFMLALLGGSMAYGMIIGFALAIVWFAECCSETRRAGKHGMWKRLFLDRRFLSLCALGLVYAFWLFIIWPAPDQFAPLSSNHISLAKSINNVLTSPAEAVAWNTAVLKPDGSDSLFWPGILVSAVILAVFFTYLYFRKKLAYGIVVFLCLFGFFLSFYYYMHHSGIVLVSMLFLLWISTADQTAVRPAPRWLVSIDQYRSKLRPVWVTAVAAVLLVQLYWSFAASFSDITLPYDSSRQLASFIRNNKLEDDRIFDSVEIYRNENDALLIPRPTILPYFNKNIFVNLNEGDPKLSFVQHRSENYDEAVRNMKEISGQPDFVIAKKSMMVTMNIMIPVEKYVKVAEFHSYGIWKDFYAPNDDDAVYIREDLLAKYPQFTSLPDLTLDSYKAMISKQKKNTD